MALHRPRRIFTSATRPSAIRAGRGVPHAVAVGLLGAVGGAALMLLAEPSELFGHAPPAPEEINAEAQQIAVVDGETLRLRDTVIRLLGIAAPPHGAICHHADGEPFDCGAVSADALALLVRNRSITCRLHGHDQAGRPLGLCEAGGHDLNRAQVDGGFARASNGLPDGVVTGSGVGGSGVTAGDVAGLDRSETDARAQRRGLWAGIFDQHARLP